MVQGQADVVIFLDAGAAVDTGQVVAEVDCQALHGPDPLSAAGCRVPFVSAVFHNPIIAKNVTHVKRFNALFNDLINYFGVAQGESMADTMLLSVQLSQGAAWNWKGRDGPVGHSSGASRAERSATLY